MSSSQRTLTTSQGVARVHLDWPVGPIAGTLLLGHGAGAGTESADLQALRALTGSGWVVALLEQPWHVAGRALAAPPPRLDEATVQIMAGLGTGRRPLPRPWILGGRSAGARVACRLSDYAQATLLIAFPLVPPGKGHKPTTSRAPELAIPLRSGIPTLVMQGQRDRFGGPPDIEQAVLDVDSPHARVRIRAYHGDHGVSRDLPALVDEVRGFVDSIP